MHVNKLKALGMSIFLAAVQVIYIFPTFADNQNLNIANNSECRVTHIGPYREQLTHGSRQISIFGWLHPTANEREKIGNALKKATSYSLTKKCSEMTISLKSTLSKFSKILKRNLSMLEDLNELETQHKIDFVSIEYSDSDTRINMESFAKWENSFSYMKQQCPDPLTNDLINSARLIYYGPEYYFTNILQHRAQLAGYESDIFQSRTKKTLEELNSIQLNLTDLTRESQEAIRTATQKVENGQVLDSTLVTQLLSFEKKPRVRKELERALAILKRRDDLVLFRNNVIAENVYTRGGSVAIVIGQYHAEDLIKKLEEQCNRQRSYGTLDLQHSTLIETGN